MMLNTGWVNVLIFIFLSSVAVIPFLNTRGRAYVALASVILISALTSLAAVKALSGVPFEVVLKGPALFGDVPIKIDALSAWFMIVINFTMLTGAIYGFNYLKRYTDNKNAIAFHAAAYIVVHFSLLAVCAVQNSFIFLLLWELLALAVFVLVIFDNTRPGTIKAGMNYLVQSHVSIVFLMVGFIYYASKTGSYDFDAIASFSSGQNSLAGTAIFLIFFAGFALKAGFIPFHTWLPYAHPAAPSHVSGIMSGVVIKIGIFGILRMLLLIKSDFITVGYFILFLSVLTGLYGVMLAIVQHDLKRLLAYHSIENIGIIGIGIGIGCLGLGTGNSFMSVLGFSGAMLHTLNHSLFKSLLFYSAGNVLQAVHTMNIEKLGGLIKKMPHTAILFLLAAVAICGLPPLNGFISEFLIYAGLYNWLSNAGIISLVAIIFALTGLVLIGGLAILCFTKAFSIVFLGTSRSDLSSSVSETSRTGLIPMYVTAAFMFLIGFFPSYFMKALQQPVSLFAGDFFAGDSVPGSGAIASLQIINRLFFGFAGLVLALAWIRKRVTKDRVTHTDVTWGCGYSPAGSKVQYTAGSFVRSYAKIAKPALDIEKKEEEITEIFPAENKCYETHPSDKLERIFIDSPLKLITKVTNMFSFLQNGHLQRYILYGIIFMAAVIIIPLLIENLASFINLLKTL